VCKSYGPANRKFTFESNVESNRQLRFEFESNLEPNQVVVIYMFNADCHVVMWELCMCSSYSSTLQLHVKWSCKHKSKLQMAQMLMFLLNSE